MLRQRSGSTLLRDCLYHIDRFGAVATECLAASFRPTPKKPQPLPLPLLAFVVLLLVRAAAPAPGPPPLCAALLALPWSRLGVLRSLSNAASSSNHVWAYASDAYGWWRRVGGWVRQ